MLWWVKRLGRIRKILLRVWKYLLVESININKRNSLSAITQDAGSMDLSSDFLLQTVYKQKKGWMDVVGHEEKCQANDWRGQTIYKNSTLSCTIHLWKCISEHEAALTARDTQEAAHLIKWPRPTQANSSEDAYGLPPSQHGAAAQSEWKLIQLPSLKDVVGPKPEHVIRLEFFFRL